MKQRGVVAGQLPLLSEAHEAQAVVGIDEGAQQELVNALADLLLQASAVDVDGTRRGGGHESEDHA